MFVENGLTFGHRKKIMFRVTKNLSTSCMYKYTNGEIKQIQFSVHLTVFHSAGQSRCIAYHAPLTTALLIAVIMT